MDFCDRLWIEPVDFIWKHPRKLALLTQKWALNSWIEIPNDAPASDILSLLVKVIDSFRHFKVAFKRLQGPR